MPAAAVEGLKPCPVLVVKTESVHLNQMETQSEVRVPMLAPGMVAVAVVAVVATMPLLGVELQLQATKSQG